MLLNRGTDKNLINSIHYSLHGYIIVHIWINCVRFVLKRHVSACNIKCFWLVLNDHILPQKTRKTKNVLLLRYWSFKMLGSFLFNKINNDIFLLFLNQIFLKRKENCKHITNREEKIMTPCLQRLAFFRLIQMYYMRSILEFKDRRSNKSSVI